MRFLDALEHRRLFALTVDVRMSGGGAPPVLTAVGQVINMELWATSTGANNTGADDGLQTLLGSIVSADVAGGAARGTLSAGLVWPFIGGGSTPGAQRDVDGDGDLDIGNTDPAATTATGLMMARSDTSTTTGGTVLSNGQSFKIANLTFTVTQLLGSDATQIRFLPHISSNTFAINAVWTEDAAIKRDGTTADNGIYVSGAAVNLTRSGGGGGNPTPGSISGRVVKDDNTNNWPDSFETPFTNFQLYIDSNFNGLKDSNEPTTWTDGSGHYTFSNLAPNVTHRVRAYPPPEWGTSYPSPNRWHDVFISSGQNVTGRDFAEKILRSGTTPGSISGTVYKALNGKLTPFGGFQLYIDSNFNGLKDSSEPTTWADGNGHYSFVNLVPNTTYRIRAFPPSGWGTISPSPNRWYDVYVRSSGNVTSMDFHESLLDVGSISGNVWRDTNANGLKDAGEINFNGFELYIDSNLNGLIDAGEHTAYADSLGNYTFVRLAPNTTYRVRAYPPPGWGTSFPGPNRWHDVFIGPSQNITGRNFGERPF